MSKPVKEVYNDGTIEYRLNGKFHREDGPALIYPDGEKYWYSHGLWHRKDGPAVIWPDGTQMWYLNGKQHREDGPAVIWSDGIKKWWLNDNLVTPEELFNKLSKEKQKEIIFNSLDEWK